MESITKIFPVTVTKLKDPVTSAMKNISNALYGLPLLCSSFTTVQKVESFEDVLHEALEKRSADWMTDVPAGR